VARGDRKNIITASFKAYVHNHLKNGRVVIGTERNYI